MITLVGKPYPLGATLLQDGVNFSIFSPYAQKVELLLFKNQKDTNPITIELSEEENCSYYYWHVFIPNLKENQLYGYRVYGENGTDGRECFDSSKVLVDPYAKAIVGNDSRKQAKVYGLNNVETCLKSVVINDQKFDWQADRSPKFKKGKTVIYEMHVGGFTKHASSDLPKDLAGTYKGMIKKIPYLKELGITTVELLPVFAFDPDDAFEGKKNYWGYSPINFFAPHAAYSSEQNPQAAVDEFKLLVRELHKAGLEVILDVVYNHTTENDKEGPNYSLRGIANSSYYMLDESNNYFNFSGTGNTINANHSVVRRMIMDSLEYWVSEMHVDGFRFDLASILARNEKGDPIPNPPILWAIESNPVLADVKLIAEPWDAAGLYQVIDFTGDKWAVWNAEYRDTLRRFLKGDGGVMQAAIHNILGGEGIIQDQHIAFTPDRNIQFITAHDGFTLRDMVSYNEKHNYDNGEGNRDGHGDNLSWNCGIEGETTNEEIQELRLRQHKNALAMLLLSVGTPMLLMGDEIGRTQNGNNNAYCQDNAISWMNWEDNDLKKELFTFTKDLIHIRKSSGFYDKLSFPKIQACTAKDFCVKLQGTQQNKLEWNYDDRAIALRFCEKDKEHILILNMHWEQLDFDLPENHAYKMLLSSDTNIEKGERFTKKIPALGRSITLLKKY